MSEEQVRVQEAAPAAQEAPAPVQEAPAPVQEAPAPVQETPVKAAPKPQENRGNRPPREGGPREGGPRAGGPREGGPREAGNREGGNKGQPGGRGPGDRGPSDRGPRSGGERRPGEHKGGPPDRRPGGGDRRFDGPPQEIDLDKLISDSLYLDNQAHIVVSRMRDMDSGTRSQLRRLYNAVRRATRTAEKERQHEFVMLRARLAYTIARHGLRSLDQLERLLLQVTRRNELRGYERFRDLFEAIVAYNE